MSIIFSGTSEVAKLESSLKKKLGLLKKRSVLKVLKVGADQVSDGYLFVLKKQADKLGVDLKVIKLPSQTNFAIVAPLVKKGSVKVLPIISTSCPLYSRREELIKKIPDGLDADFLNLKRFVDWERLPSVCRAVLYIIDKVSKTTKIDFRKKKVLVVGENGFWGSRIKQALADQGFQDTIGAGRDADLITLGNQADILVSCVGQPGLIKAEMVKKKAVVIDVGCACLDKSWFGDVDFAKVSPKTRFITPFPDGIGPLSTFFIFENLIKER
ncbi:hypothetical protein ACFLZP_03550 [Patescibacteria group bacterium]